LVQERAAGPSLRGQPSGEVAAKPPVGDNKLEARPSSY
jgi:hypothetical protein